jgi:pimeloyl-ACP methyl ester carboxylesterase
MNWKNTIIACLASLFSCGRNKANSYAPTYQKLYQQGMIHQLSEKDLHKNFIQALAGRIAYYETPGTCGPLLLIHGNSCSKEYMIKQLDGLGLRYKMIAFDLPGHGESDNAKKPQTQYTLAGYAHLIAEVIQNLNLDKPIIVGWSLGGHIALEMMADSPHLIRGVIIASCPPFTPSPEGLQEAYLPTYSTPLGSKREQFTLEDVKAYITQGIIDFDKHPLLAEASMRADGLARSSMVNAVMQGEGVNERYVAETSPIPLGIIMGAREHAVNNEYTKKVQYANCIMMQTIDAGHDCQWSHPEEFNDLVDKFAQQVLNQDIQI